MKYSVLMLVTLAACGRQSLDPADRSDNHGPMDGPALPSADAGPDVASDRDLGMSVDALGVDHSTDSVDGGRERDGGPSDATFVPYRAISVAAGTSHTCALLDDHNIKCWGDNVYGALGTGDPANRGDVPGDMGNNLPIVKLGTARTAKAVSAARYATCAILDDDSVKCWGWTAQALGGGQGAPSGPRFAIGDEAGEMGDALPRIDLGSGHTARLLAVGYSSTCVVRDDQSTYCWGTSGLVRDVPAVPGRTITKLVGADGVLALFDDGTVSAIVGNPLGPPPSAVVKAVAIAGSRTRSGVLWDNGMVTGLSNAWSQQDGVDLASPVLTESGYPCGVYKDGSVTCPTITGLHPWLGPDAGHGPTVRVGQPVVSIAAGLYYFCAALADGGVKCWSLDDRWWFGLGNGYPTGASWPSVDLGTRVAGP